MDISILLSKNGNETKVYIQLNIKMDMRKKFHFKNKKIIIVYVE